MADNDNSLEYLALTREAGIAAELLASGVTALGKANYAQHGWYNQAFFNLSIGLERAAKLAIIVDYAINNSGVFPSNQGLKELWTRHQDKNSLEPTKYPGSGAQAKNSLSSRPQLFTRE